MTDNAKFERRALIHMDAAHNLALCLLGERADAEDALQDAYLRAYRAFDQLEGDDIKPWLLTIVRNVCYRRLQERRRAGNVISLDEALSPRPGSAAPRLEIAAPDRSPEDDTINNFDQSVLAQAIAALPPAFREVIVLREIEELSYREIADIIGGPVGTVMSRLSRAREALRGQLTSLFERDDSDAM